MLTHLRSEAEVRYLFLRSDLRQFRDKALLRLARRLPARVTYWCAIVVIANATSGDHDIAVADLGPMQALELWEKDHALY